MPSVKDFGNNCHRVMEEKGWLAPVISAEALAGCREVLTDERLDYLGERYRRLGIRYWTGVEFHKYLLHPEALEAEADRRRCYVAFKLVGNDDETYELVVSTTN